MPASRSVSSSHADSAVSTRNVALFAGIILIGANLRAPITSLGPVLPDIQRAVPLDGLGAGALNALPLLLFAVLSLVAPAIGRRHGLERILGCSLIAIAFGTLARSLALPGALWFGTALLSVGIAFGNVLLPGLVKREFPAASASLIGFYAAAMAAMAGMASGLAVPITWIPGLDWRWAIAAPLVLALLALIVWTPQWRALPHRLDDTGDSAAIRSPWRHAVGWQVSLFFALHSFVFYSLVDWFPSYAAAHGISIETAGVYMLVYQVVAVATNLGSASLIRRLQDQTWLGFGCGVLLLIGTGGLLLLPGLAWLWIISAGMGAGVAMVTSLSLFALRTQTHHQAASLSGMAQFIGYLGAAAGPLLVGIVHDITRSWTAPMLLLIGSSTLVIVFATLAGRRRVID